MKNILFLFTIITLFSCDTIKKSSNSTGTVFSLNGEWQLTANSDNSLIGSSVLVYPFVPDAKFKKLVNNTQCFRETDVKWKNIATDNNGGFTVNNLQSSCTGGAPQYVPAAIVVVNTNEIKVNGKNAAGENSSQTWKRISTAITQ